MIDRFVKFWQRMSDEKRGITTSEFWMSLGSLISTVAGVLFGILPIKYAVIVSSLITIGYCLSRGLAKRKPDDNNTYYS